MPDHDEMLLPRLVHFADRALTRVEAARQNANLSTYGKPRGLWVSDEAAEQSWSQWCADENFRDTSRQVATEVTLAADHDLLWLSSALDLHRFTDAFGVPNRYGDRAINWGAVAAGHSGIVITPYVWEARRNLSWYYGWDCASGCIWDPSCVIALSVADLEGAF